VILRFSEKLNTKIKAGKLSALPLDSNPYADWSCHLFTADWSQYILLSNTASFYSCVMFGKGITNEGIFISRALDTIREYLDDAGHQFVHRKFIAPSSETIRFAKSLNRSVTGSMNDLINHARLWLAEGDLSPHDVSIKLNTVLLSALRTEGSPGGYGKPVDAFKRLEIPETTL
jgi:hypothetical protein